MNSPFTLVKPGATAEAQLSGGAQDGREILIDLVDGLPPPFIVRPSGRYELDLSATTAGGLLVYALKEGRPL